MKLNIQIRRLNYILSAALITLLVTACEKRLDILPYQSITSDNALASESDVDVTLIGAYDGAQAATTYGGDIMVLNDLIGNNANINFTGTFAGLTDAYQTLMVSNNSFAEIFSSETESSSFDFKLLTSF
jgi:hypothetical protein